MLKHLSKDQKTVITTLVSIAFLLSVAGFLLFKMLPVSSPEVATEEVENPPIEKQDDHLVDENDHEHATHEDQPVIFDETDSSQVNLSYLKLSRPTKIANSYNLNSKADFLGNYEDERVYVLAHKGQLYHYNMEKKDVYTYENLVVDAAVDSETGNLLYTKFNDGLNPSLSVYKVLREYPEPVKMFETSERFELKDFVFYKDTFIFSFFDLDSGKIKSFAYPGSVDVPNNFTNLLRTSFSNSFSSFSTDGTKLIAYDHSQNAVVDLSTGTPSVIQKFEVPVYAVNTAIKGDKVLISGSDKLGESYFTLLNGKKISKESFFELSFYDDRFAFVNDGAQLQLLDTESSIITAVEQVVPEFSLSGNHLYFSNNFGEILKMKIERTES